MFAKLLFGVLNLEIEHFNLAFLKINLIIVTIMLFFIIRRFLIFYGKYKKNISNKIFI